MVVIMDLVIMEKKLSLNKLLFKRELSRCKGIHRHMRWEVNNHMDNNNHTVDNQDIHNSRHMVNNQYMDNNQDLQLKDTVVYHHLLNMVNHSNMANSLQLTDSNHHNKTKDIEEDKFEITKI